MKKTYIAYAIYDVERSCGCTECVHVPVYDIGGNKYKQFDNKEDAEDAARTLMLNGNYDRWNVI